MSHGNATHTIAEQYSGQWKSATATRTVSASSFQTVNYPTLPLA